MEEYKDITVTYTLDAYQQQQLENIYQAYKEKGYEFDSVDSLFENIMTLGSRYDVAEKLGFSEFQAGISDYKTRNEIYQETKDRLEKNEQTKHPIEKTMEDRIDTAVDQMLEASEPPEPELDMEP